MDCEELYRKFKESKQEKLRLEIALQEFLKDGSSDRETGTKEAGADMSVQGACFGEGCQEKWKEYGNYLKLRIRPAMEVLIRQGDVDKLEKLSGFGWIKEEQMEDFLRIAMQLDNRSVLLCLLHIKNRTFGFKDKEFLL